ncbi:MAG: flavin reductase family protein [Rhodospirillaceae bacterium]
MPSILQSGCNPEGHSVVIDKAVAPLDLRSALARFATGVTIVTAYSNDGSYFGMTVNSFTSLSLEPPLVMWSIDRNASLYDSFQSVNRFAVNVLSESQKTHCMQFASNCEDRFSGVDIGVDGNGGPHINGALSTFDCTIEQRHNAGDHQIIIGRVESLFYQDGRPLIFYSGELTSLT